MKKLLLFLALFASVSSATHGAAIIVGSFSTVRAGNSSVAQGPATQDLRNSLVGAFPGSTFVGVDTLTSASLSTLNLVIVGSPTFNPPAITLSSSEADCAAQLHPGGTRRDYLCRLFRIFAGGPNESFLDPFGMHATGKLPGQPNATSVAPNHRVMNGPFGVVTTFATSVGGWFDNLGPNATALVDLRREWPTAPCCDRAWCPWPGSGGVVFIADADSLVDTAAGGFFTLRITRSSSLMQ
jgi:hypothetical protein